MKLSKVRGTRDLLRVSAFAMTKVIQTGQNLLLTAGFQPVFLPILEREDLFQHSLGDGSDIVMKEMFKVHDPSGNQIVLRPEGTVGCMRAYLEACPGECVKWQYSGSMFRRERPQQGRYREFVQLGAEVIGLPSQSFVDVELIQLGAELLDLLGIQAELRINTLGVVAERQQYIEALKRYFGQNKDKLSLISQERLGRSPLRILDSKEPQDRLLLDSAPRLSEYLLPRSKGFFQDVLSSLKTLKIKYVEDPWLVRGLDYYSHTCYEFINDGRAVLAGGRYDSLAEELGAKRQIPSSGWAAGVDRLAELLKPEEQKTIGVVALCKAGDQVCYDLVPTLRRQLGTSYSVVMVPGGLSAGKSLQLVNKLQASLSIIVGEDELKSSNFQLKDMKTGLQTTHPMSDLPGLIRRITGVN